jgi:16S rRNA (cytosine967-C5)-methyltransferase
VILKPLSRVASREREGPGPQGWAGEGLFYAESPSPASLPSPAVRERGSLTPGAQVAAAIDVLAVIDAGERPADDTAADYFRRRRYIGAKDRTHIAGHVYAVLRHRASLDWWIRRHPVEIGPRSRVLAALVLIEGWPPQAIIAGCDGDRFRPAPLSEVEVQLVRDLASRTPRHPEMPRAAGNDLPEWLEPYLERVFGKGLEREMAALNAAAPIDLRVNLLKADRVEARRALVAEGVAAEPTPWSPIGLRLSGRVPLGGLVAFKDGLVEVQDEGSQIAALLADARPGMRVVDFCAGAGGKTLALAAGMEITASSSPATCRPVGSNAPRADCAAPGSAMSSDGR